MDIARPLDRVDLIITGPEFGLGPGINFLANLRGLGRCGPRQAVLVFGPGLHLPGGGLDLLFKLVDDLDGDRPTDHGGKGAFRRPDAHIFI